MDVKSDKRNPPHSKWKKITSTPSINHRDNKKRNGERERERRYHIGRIETGVIITVVINFHGCLEREPERPQPPRVSADRAPAAGKSVAAAGQTAVTARHRTGSPGRHRRQQAPDEYQDSHRSKFPINQFNLYFWGLVINFFFRKECIH